MQLSLIMVKTLELKLFPIMELDSKLRHGGNSVEYKIVSTALQHGKLLMKC